MNKAKLSTLLVALLAMSGLVGCNHNNNSSSSDITSSDNSSSSALPSSNNSSSAAPETIYIKDVRINKETTDILLGSTEKLSASYTPTNATETELVWTSDDETIATVDQTGLVTAKKVGTANITCKPKVIKDNVSVGTCQVNVKDNVILTGVSAKHEFVLFEQNRVKDEKNDDGFYDHTQTYKVGDDNRFNVKPELSVSDATTFQPVSASRWLYDFTISAKLGDQTVGEEYFKVLDARECDVKFTEAAVGKTFTINVAPGGVAESRIAALTKSITVDVIDGYNVYNAKELGYFDTREQDSIVDTPVMEDGNDWQCKWAEFKTANGMDATYHPASLIFQKDIAVTTEDLPANFFYTKAQAQALNDTKAEGSLVDYTYLYERTIAGDITVDGNYFALDLSAIPLIKRDRCKTTAVGAVVGHSSTFKVIAGGDVAFRNINMTGNARNALDDNDKIYGGGIMFVKGAGSTSLKAFNVIATKFFITFFGEKPYTDGNPITQFELNKVKCFNNYNSFMYNWGSVITASHSLFRSCGGPVIIQDHKDYDEKYEEENGLVVKGFVPTVNFIGCDIQNYVSGKEAWFQQFNATGVVPSIKSMSDLLYATGIQKSFVVNSNHEGKLFQALSAADQNAFFNFIVLNKSAEAEGITTKPACGVVSIVNEGDVTFNYRQPAYDEIYKLSQAYAAETDPQKQLGYATEMAALLQAKGYEINPDFSNLADQVTAYVTSICTEHALLRGLNDAGAPVIDLGESFDLIGYDGQNNFLQTLPTIYAEIKQGQPASRYQPSADQLADIPDSIALYYNGMALVMELVDLVL